MNEFRKTDFKLMAGLALVALLLAACGGGGEPTSTEPASPAATEPVASGGMGSGLCANPYLPIVEGASWSYTGTGLEEAYSYTTTVSAVRADGFEYTHNFDDLVLTQQWGCTAEGLAALEYGGGPEAAITTTGMTSSFETTDSSGVTLPSSISIGQSWSQTYTLEGTMTVEDLVMESTGTATHTFTAIREESVTVPAGTFTAMRMEGTNVIDLQASVQGAMTLPFHLEAVTVSWWVQGIGMVRSESSIGFDGSDGFTDVTELISYSIP